MRPSENRPARFQTASAPFFNQLPKGNPILAAALAGTAQAAPKAQARVLEFGEDGCIPALKVRAGARYTINNPHESALLSADACFGTVRDAAGKKLPLEQGTEPETGKSSCFAELEKGRHTLFLPRSGTIKNLCLRGGQ